VYADTQVLIYSVERHPLYAPLMRPLWAAVQSGTLEVISSELVILEALVLPIRNGDAGLIAAYDQFFVQAGFRLQAITGSLLREAARLRAVTRLRTPDAMHAATALQTNSALFVTNDQDFRRVSGLSVQILDDLISS
jgi:predicted nucleic acid-binding protein